jgi:hypothetical protein
MAEGLRAFYLLTLKLVKCYSRKMRDSRFLKMDDSLIFEAVLVFSAPHVSSGAVAGLVSPSSELVDSKEGNNDLWGGEGKTKIFLTLWVTSPPTT